MMTYLKLFAKLATLVSCLTLSLTTLAQSQQAPAPLFRDPITDGVADPVVIYNPIEKAWWMLYTQRRANNGTWQLS